MTIAFNGVGINAINFNGVSLGSVRFNGVEVWSAAPVLQFNPTSHTHSGYSSSVFLELRPNGSMLYGDDDGEQLGSWLTRSMVLGVSYPITIKNSSPTPSNIALSITGMGGGNISTTLGRTQSVSRTLTPTTLSNDNGIGLYSSDSVDNTIYIEVTLLGVTKTFVFISP